MALRLLEILQIMPEVRGFHSLEPVTGINAQRKAVARSNARIVQAAARRGGQGAVSDPLRRRTVSLKVADEKLLVESAYVAIRTRLSSAAEEICRTEEILVEDEGDE